MNTQRTHKDSPTHDITRRVSLGNHAMLTLRPRAGQWLRVLEGSIHLTRDGLPQDVFLVAGRRWPVQAPGSVLVEALGSARLMIIRPATRLERALAWAKSATRSMSRAAQRTGRRVVAGGRILL